MAWQLQTRGTRALAAALVLALTVAPARAQQISSDEYAQLPFRYIGPVGNRVPSVAGVPGDPSTYFAGAASGGIWKTEDGGLHWRPVFDDQPVHSIGALAVAPSDHQIVWAGTGEPFLRSNVSIGNGVWKSTDGGETWAHMGLEGTGRIARVVIHPTNPDIVYVAAVGHTYAPQQERGVYRTTDGGATWKRVLFVDENTGSSDLAMDPKNPRILFAGMWQIELKTWTRQSGGPGSGIFVSRNGGDDWTRLTGHGLPDPPVGKIGLCLSATDSRRVYALIETADGVPMPINDSEPNNGELWRSDDGGVDWQLISYNHDLAARSAYYTRCAVEPDDRDEVLFVAGGFSRSTDGGASVKTTNFFGDDGSSAPGWDHHDIWIDPTNGDRMVVGYDGGVSISENRGYSWFRVQLPNAQMYHVTADTKIPYNVYANRQDGPSFRGPSNTRTGGFFASGIIPRGEWHAVGGGESGFATPDPEDPDIIWSSASGSGAQGGIVVRYDERTRQFRNVEVWPLSTFGWPADSVRYRFQWTFPLLISPHDRHTLYVTSQVVHRTTNEGQSWEVISPDLTTNDTSKMGFSGGLTPDNLGVEYCCVIYAFDESPVQAGVLWAGTNDGLVHVTRDGGRHWTDVTRNIPDLPPLGVVRSIDASRWSAGKAYITVEHHQMGDFAPRAYKTEDFGAHWTRITTGIDNAPLSYTRYLLEDPVRPGLLYLGTESKLYVSFDDGAHWQSFMNGLPPAPMYGMVVQESFDDLVLGTYGRGIWILDDLSPLQQLTPEVVASEAHLFTPRDAYRFRPTTEPAIMFEDPTVGKNPEYGASLNYWLKEAPSGDVTLRILDAAGDTVRTLTGTKKPGINRVWWNLQGEQSTAIKLRTKPLYAEWVEMPDSGWRSPGGRFSVLQPPGSYTVVLDVDGATYRKPLTVLKDPNSEGALADIQAQTALVRDLWREANAVAGMVNQIELIRRQLYDLDAVVAAREGGEDVRARIDSLDAQFLGVERQLIQLRITGGSDGVRWPSRIVSRLAYLVGNVTAADFRPTDQDLEVHDVLKDQIATAQRQLDGLLERDLPAFNRLLRQAGAGAIMR